MELEIIVEQFQKKDADAFQKLYNMYSENICGVINTIVKNNSVAEEICQDVFMKAWNNAESYNASKGRFFTWILNIARNAAIDEIRSKSHKNSKKNLSADYFVGILESMTDSEEGKEDIIGLKKLLVNLKDKCIEIIELLYFKGLTQKEVSKELDIPLGTVKTRNRSCISQIRTNMAI
ncbi:RNA polymerase sigma factor [Arenibacter algicola]|uniref:ECF RNA polymerase sigma factor RpoE n=1 Tax=Arenibacter algicola TaxID=616991 RepID=A0A221V2K9_9FLAO|nr:sigma-70 family RNA polymerase sigma factor [Arenibacter algicola]ASO07618.1 ECF RNA polymerase sigma factor RpoE [Arenibacter algicola]HCO82533.1 sigma-70 family RNA polymerase sigma factor [Arenibacter sp.]|tara:strand:- start:7033 stop:7566 length:534 start_codon:yes stop_codon:yes gene_type:complete